MGKLFAAAAIAGVVGLGSVTAAEAGTGLPNVETFATLGSTLGHNDYLGAGTYSYTYNDSPAPEAGTINASMQVAPFPFISVDASGCCHVDSGNASVDVIYYAELTGPDLGPLSMELFEHLASSQSGSDAGGWAQAEATGYLPGGSSSVGQEIVFSNGPDIVDGAGTTPGVLRFSAAPGQPIEIHLSLNAYVTDGSTSSSADPFLTIDPSFAAVDPNYSSDYSLSFSPGIVNAPGAVPEPATWAMMLLGFTAIALSMRRKSAVVGDRRGGVIGI